MSTKKGNLPFEQELFETCLCYKGLILRAAWENWAFANPKWSSDLKKLPVTAEVVAVMPALSLMHPECLSSSVGKMARNQYGVCLLSNVCTKWGDASFVTLNVPMTCTDLLDSFRSFTCY